MEHEKGITDADGRCMLEKLAVILKRNGISVFEYFPEKDKLILYDEQFQICEEHDGYLAVLSSCTQIPSDDRRLALEFYCGKIKGPVEIRINKKNSVSRKLLDMSVLEKNTDGSVRMIGSIRDVTAQRVHEDFLNEQIKRDPLTGLYNSLFGKKLINEYLKTKNPNASCGLVVIDADYFKRVNDNYGHLFGDTVLIRLADFLAGEAKSNDIVMRAGGDEFVILFKDTGHSLLIRKAVQIVKGSRNLTFSQMPYSMTCSVGVCFLPGGIPGRTYDQLFCYADRALYQAKGNGRNCYSFYRDRLNGGEAKTYLDEKPENFRENGSHDPGYGSNHTGCQHTQSGSDSKKSGNV